MNIIGKFKFIFINVLIFSLMLLFLPNIKAADYTIQNKETGETYLSLQDAINKVGDGQTIEIISDEPELVTLYEHVKSEGKNYNIDFGGTILDGSKNEKNLPLFIVYDGVVTLSNGTFQNNSIRSAKGSTDVYETNYETYGGGAGLLVHDSGKNGNFISEVTLEKMKITRNTASYGAGIEVIHGKLTIIDSEISHNSAIWDQNIGNTGEGGGIYARSKTRVYIDNNTKVSYNSAKNGAAVYIRDYLNAKDSKFVNNTGMDGKNTQAIIYLSGSSSTTLGTMGQAEFSNCQILNNQSGMETIFIENKESIFKSCEIRGNTSYRCGGIYHNKGKVDLYETIINDNHVLKSNINSYSQTSGGISANLNNFNYHSGAIYNNTNDLGASDIFALKDSTAKADQRIETLMEASEMKDGEYDFTHYAWLKEDENPINSTIIETTEILKCQNNSDLKVAAVNNNPDIKVAEYNNEKYNRLIDAVLDTKLHETSETPIIKLIAGDPDDNGTTSGLTQFYTQSVSIENDLIIDLNEKTIFPNAANATDKLFDIKENANLILKGPGTIGGTIYLEEKSELTLDCILKQDFYINCSEGSSQVNLSEEFSNTGNTIFILSDEQISQLNNFDNSSKIELVKGSLEKIDLNRIILSRVNNPTLKFIKEDNKLIAQTSNVKSVNSFVVSNNGSDDNDGSYDSPKKTIESILIDNNNLEEITIYIKDNYRVERNETWGSEDSNQKIINIKRIYEDPDLKNSNMIIVPKGVTLNTYNVKIDGGTKDVSNVEESLKPYNAGSIINIQERGTLNLGINTILENNSISKSGKTLDKTSGGAIYSKGIVNIDIGPNGYIRNCDAFNGGAICMRESSATLNLKSGKIVNNQALPASSPITNNDPKGGAILIARGAVMNMKGGTIKRNYSAQAGGAISIGASTDADKSDKEYSPSDYDFYMTGGRILKNTSAKEGGGLYIQATYKGLITAGRISKNESKSGNFGGGGIYVNGLEGNNSNLKNGKVVIQNVEITGNTATFDGGGIAVCETGSTMVTFAEGNAIYGNTSSNKFIQPKSEINRNDDLALLTFNGGNATGMTGDTRKGPNPDQIGNLMIDGTPYLWRQVTPFGEEGEIASEEYLKGYHYKQLYTNSSPTNRSKIKTFITNNISNTRGGGIGSNGDIIIGDPEERFDQITINKSWIDSSGKITQFENYKQYFTNINIWAYAKSNQEGFSDDYFVKNSLYRRDYDRSEDLWFNNVKFDKYDKYQYYFIEEIILNNGKHIIYNLNNSEIDLEILKGEIKKRDNLQEEDFILVTDTPFSSSLESIENNENQFTLTNKLKTGNLQIEKTVLSKDGTIPDPNTIFSFNVKLTNELGLIDNNYHYTILRTNGTEDKDTLTLNENGIGEVNLKADEKIIIENIPVGTNYQITENLVLESGFKLSQENNLNGTIEEGISEENLVRITNLYGSDIGSFSIPIKKTIIGNPQEKDTFTFSIESKEDYGNKIKLPEPNTVEIIDSGVKWFDNIIFYQKGKYIFTIKETSEVENYITDTTVYTLGITVDNAENPLELEVINYELFKDDEEVLNYDGKTPLEFINTHRTEEPSAKKEEILKNGESITADKIVDYDDYISGPVVDVSDSLTYLISWHQVIPANGIIQVIDRLDKGVDFISASYKDITLSSENTITEGDVTITYDSESHTVTWTFENGSKYSTDSVNLTVQVNENADSYWSYSKDDPTLGIEDSEKADHSITNKAVVVGNDYIVTKEVRNKIVGLFIEKIHFTVSSRAYDDQYRPDGFESGGVFDLPENAFDPAQGMGFTELLDDDTEDNAYKKTFTHDYSNTVRYYIKVTNNYPEQLDHVIIMDPVRIHSIQGTKAETSFGGIAGTVNNEPQVEGRTQDSISVSVAQDADGNYLISDDDIVTFKIVSSWAENWNEAKVRVETTLSDQEDIDFVGAYYKNTDNAEGAFGLLKEEYINGKNEDGIFTKEDEAEEYLDTFITFDGQTIFWEYKIDNDDPEEDNIMYLRLVIPDSHNFTDQQIEELNPFTYGGFIENIIEPKTDGPKTNDVKAIFNPDDIDGDSEIDELEGYLRWEFEVLPGTNALEDPSTALSPDGYPANVQMVYFDWDIPNSMAIDEFTMWKNTAYVQTMEQLKNYLRTNESTQEKYNEYIDILDREENEEVESLDLDNSEEEFETIAYGRSQARPLLIIPNDEINEFEDEIMVIDEDGPTDGEGTGDEGDQNENPPNTDDQQPSDESDSESLEEGFSGDKSNTDHVSIYSLFGWRSLMNGMLQSNTVREVINVGNLEIKKQVVGSDNEDAEFSFIIEMKFLNELTNTDEARDLDGIFIFRDKDGKTLPYSINEGKGSFVLKNGETIRLENIPLNTTFTITEVGAEDYDVKNEVTYFDRTVTSTGNVVTGQIKTSNFDTKILCTNTLIKKDETKDPEKPDEPDKPNKPNNPDEPETPDDTEEVEKPDNPDEPNNPDEPDKPNDSDKPGTPDDTGKEPNNSDQSNSPNAPDDQKDSPSGTDTKTGSTTTTPTSNSNNTVTNNTTTERVSTTASNPKTGVASSLGIWTILIGGSGIGLLLGKNKKRKK